MIWTPHTTVATIAEHQGRYLLVEEVVDGRTVLNQPAGHIEPHESLLAAARRETLEETGWQVELEALVGIYHYPAPNGVSYFRYCFAARTLDAVPDASLDEGIIGPLWLTLEELESRRAQWRSPMVKRCIEDYAAGKRYPLNLIHEYPHD
ncbi:MAG: NUDIX hydrolase [Pseudomonadota bacterium]|nr:NUDIX hydrolase [Pseudomonadales bacterium]MDY6921791.1 NUDIX hydrolase [Pseudomonadota bacterium]